MGCFIHMHTCNTYNIYSIQVNAIELKEVRPCPHLVDGGASSAEERGGAWRRRRVEAERGGGGEWRRKMKRRRVEAENETLVRANETAEAEAEGHKQKAEADMLHFPEAAFSRALCSSSLICCISQRLLHFPDPLHFPDCAPFP